MKYNYLLVNISESKLEFYTQTSLFCKYQELGIVSASDILIPDDINFFIKDLIYRGILVFPVKFGTEITNLQGYKVIATKGTTKLEFDNLFAAIDHCKLAGLSSAGTPHIRTTLLKNLMNQTSSAYGFNWKFEVVKLEVENYKIEIFI